MKLSEIEISDHPLRKEIIEKGIRLQQLRRLLGGAPSENVLSRALRGIDQMPQALAQRIKKILRESEGDGGQE